MSSRPWQTGPCMSDGDRVGGIIATEVVVLDTKQATIPLGSGGYER
jgi:hypothetical protein